MAVNTAQIAQAKTHGLTNVEHLAVACDRHRLPFYLGCTILQKETGGRNIFGHDRGGAFSVAGQNIEVTEDRYREFRRLIDAGKTSNGVGPMQITWKGFFPDMESKGLRPWVPADNISYGIGLLAADFNRARRAGKSVRSAFRSSARQYNGSRAYGIDALAKSVVWKSRVGTVDLDAAPVGAPVAARVASGATTTITQPKPEQGSATERITFRGFRTTTRTRNMIMEAERLFGEFGGGEPPSMSQGGYNPGGVAASAGTHDQDAIDWKTRFMSRRRRRLWELCLWMVGFKSWIRSRIVGLWESHTHGIPEGGELSAGAAAQVAKFHSALNALKSNKPYPRILDSGYARQTWETYLAEFEVPTVSVAALVAAFSVRSVHDDVRDVQRALNVKINAGLDVDGDPGPLTKAAYQRVDPDGVPDDANLIALGLGVGP